jgi:hypothetical protein
MAKHIARLALVGLVFLSVLTGACSIIRVNSGSDPARIESRGLIKGHAAAGIPAEDHLFHLDLFDGTSDGAIAELVVWKLFRFELGLAGVSIGVGPFSLGLGIFFYEAKTPEMKSQKRESESTDVDPADEPEQ